MKQNLLFILLSFFLTSTISAQDSLFTLSPNPVEQDFVVNDLNSKALDQALTTTITNISSDTLELIWVRMIMESPEAWETQVCDNVACYLPFVSTNWDEDLDLMNPAIIPPGDTMDLIIYVLPNGQEGSGSFQLQLFSNENRDSMLTAVNMSTTITSSTTSTVDEAELRALYLYPNPVTHSFRLTETQSIERITVYNTLGMPIKTFQVYNGAEYDISELPQGIYLVTYMDRRNEILKTSRFTKYSYRP
ncbi:MAG: T9SS type A sorting domain-containing protein [Bacteroidota bacterium]